MELLHREEGLVVGDNEPYSVTDASDYTIPVHGEQRDLHHVALEIRQDLITDEAGQRMWAALFARLLSQAYQRLTSLQGPQVKPRTLSDRWALITGTIVASRAFVRLERG
jgi:predicted N-formylglutamate amidohydrolase